MPLVRWKLPPECVKTPSNFQQEDINKWLEASEYDDFLYEHWVEGTVAYITTNINTDLGIKQHVYNPSCTEDFILFVSPTTSLFIRLSNA